jgi:hypothetical protein
MIFYPSTPHKKNIKKCGIVETNEWNFNPPPLDNWISYSRFKQTIKKKHTHIQYILAPLPFLLILPI